MPRSKNSPAVTVQPSEEDQNALAVASDTYGVAVVKEWTDNGYDVKDIDFLERTIPALNAGQHMFVGTLAQMGNALEEIIRRAPHGQLSYILRRAGVTEDVALTARHVYKAVTAYPALADMSTRGLLPPSAIGRIAQSKAFKDNPDELIGAIAEAVATGEPLTLGDARGIIESYTPDKPAAAPPEPLDTGLTVDAAAGLLDKILRPAAKMLGPGKQNARAAVRKSPGYKAFARALVAPTRPAEDPTLASMQDLLVILYTIHATAGADIAAAVNADQES